MRLVFLSPLAPSQCLSGLPDVLRPELEANSSLDFAQDLIIRNDWSTLIVSSDLWLSIDFHCLILLSQPLVLLALLDHLARLQGHLVLVQLGRVLGDLVLFVLASGPFDLKVSTSVLGLLGPGLGGCGALLAQNCYRVLVTLRHRGQASPA